MMKRSCFSNGGDSGRSSIPIFRSGGNSNPFRSSRLLQRKESSSIVDNLQAELEVAASEQERSQLDTLKETKAVKYLKVIFLNVLLATALALALLTWFYIQSVEKQEFETHFIADSKVVVDAFFNAVQRQLGAITSMSTSITSLVLASPTMAFPNVTIPDFEARAADLRVLTGALTVHYFSLVNDSQREAWEAYALENRNQMTEAGAREAEYRQDQDEYFDLTGVNDNRTFGRRRRLDAAAVFQDDLRRLQQFQHQYPENLLNDNTSYRPRIWDSGGISGMENRGKEYPPNSGPYLPGWQISPTLQNLKLGQLNQDFTSTKLFDRKALASLLETKSTTMSKAIIPVPLGRTFMDAYLLAGQYRHISDNYRSDPLTYVAQPVFDTLGGGNRSVAGVLASNLYWRLFLTDILPPTSQGIICVVSNSFNQTFAYRIDGAQAKYIGQGDPHDPNYNYLERSVNVNEHLESSMASPVTSMYNSVPLNSQFGQYRLSVYPSADTEAAYRTNKAVVYTCAVAAIFVFVALLFGLYDYMNERRQRLVRNRALQHAKRAARTERELNEFISHEVRNPLAAALSAGNFVASELTSLQLLVQQQQQQGGMMEPQAQPQPLFSSQEAAAPAPLFQVATEERSSFAPSASSEFQKQLESVQDDVAIIQSSLTYMDALLRGMQDLHLTAKPGTAIDSGTMNKEEEQELLQLHLAPTDLVKDVLEPVASLLYTRDETFDIILEDQNSVTVKTDPLRLKQVVLNLVRNSARFLTTHSRTRQKERGFIRLKVEVNSQPNVLIAIEDSGPGIPQSERNDSLFAPKFKGALNLQRQGTTGIGLCLAKKLMSALKGDIYLDDEYDSGMGPDRPGSRFVVQLNTPPLCGEDGSASSDGCLPSKYETGVAGVSSRTATTFCGDSSRRFTAADVANAPSTKSLCCVPEMATEKLQQATSSNSSGGSLPVEKKQEPAPAPSSSLFDAPFITSAPPTPVRQPVLLATPLQPCPEQQQLPVHRSVLFVDDDMVLRKLFCRAVRKVAPDWHVEEASSGETALRRIKQQFGDDIESQISGEGSKGNGSATSVTTTTSTTAPLFDLILMDQYMPGTERQLLGTETTRALRAQGVTSVICGLSANDMEQQFLQAGADSFLLKPLPCKRDELERVLTRLLQLRERPPSLLEEEDATSTATSMLLETTAATAGVAASIMSSVEDGPQVQELTV